MRVICLSGRGPKCATSISAEISRHSGKSFSATVPAELSNCRNANTLSPSRILSPARKDRARRREPSLPRESWRSRSSNPASRRAKSRFNVRLVTENLELPDAIRNRAPDLHVVLLERFSEDLEVPGAQHSSVFLDLHEVRIRAPLSDLMLTTGLSYFEMI